jgi:hypothetical protein
MKKGLFSLLALTLLFLSFLPKVESVRAVEGSVLGIHILHPSEGESASELLHADQSNNDWHYVTIPLSLDDLHKKDEWDKFCQFAKQQKLIPIVRLVTTFSNGAWQVPTHKNIVDEITFLSALDWPTDQRYIIAFNEVNHAQEWGGRVDPAGYADVLKFTSNWALSEEKTYRVLPAAMDLAAPNSGSTQEAFAYLDQMRANDQHIFDYITEWNSHSYPNPGFSAAPTASGKNSLSGFKTELAYLKEKTGKELRTFITETGWVDNAATGRSLNSYYQYAVQQVWSDPRVIAVTPFVLQGDPGPFSGFSFLNRNGQPTQQYAAYQRAIKDAEKKT